MADKNARFEKNVQGPYYCDTSCIACNACVDLAPNHYAMDDEANLAFVYKQPQNTEERLNCDEALGSCPVDAIGSDG
jgi:ferredoxin